jgi:pimeloyl-ACP methyl ester carboxylesterase
MTTHFLERSLDSEKSKAILARNPSGKAIIFVHGYGGNAIETWSKFDSLLPESQSCTSHDLIFYGYDGIRADTVASASIFLEFLEDMFTNAAAKINRTLPAAAQRSQDFSYREIVIAAHSLGAVITRWALMMAFEHERSWPSKTKMVLYAPAHRGANVVKIALEGLSGFRAMQLLSGFARFQSPLIDQLAQDSQYLRELQDRVNRIVGISDNHCLLARAVFIAEREHVVVNLPFSRDRTRFPSPIQTIFPFVNRSIYPIGL